MLSTVDRDQRRWSTPLAQIQTSTGSTSHRTAAGGRIVAEQQAPNIETDTLLLAAVGEHDTKGI
jgi:hypothetical protein